MGREIVEALVDEGLKLYFSLSPGTAVELGFHEYDGMLPNWSAANVLKLVTRVHGFLYRLRALDLADLGREEWLEARLLRQTLEAALFTVERLRFHETLPALYLFSLSTVPYVARNYAPFERRMEAVTKLQSAIPSHLRSARRNLRARLPGPYVELGIMMAQGLEGSYRTELPSLGERLPQEQRSAFDEANARAQAALARFRKALEKRYKPQATGNFAIGEENFLAMLRANDAIHMSIAELKALGQADLERNERAFVETARRIDPTKSPMEVMAMVGEKHPTAEGLIPETQAMLEELRDFLIDQRVVSIPSEVRAQVAETPAYMRAVASAAMNSPGAFETSDEAYYYVTPVDLAWTPERADQWLRYMNYGTLKNTSVHEAYPGHYVHFLHIRHRTQGRMPKIFTSYAFSEGWAHYTEEMMLEMGYGRGDDQLRLVQLQDALLRNSRYMVALGMHTEGMPLEEATRFFMEHGFMDRLPAEREAFRGTFDPGFLSYTLGKLIIKHMRDEYMARNPGTTLGKFHDRILSFGAPPIGLLRQLLFGDGIPRSALGPPAAPAPS